MKSAVAAESSVNSQTEAQHDEAREGKVHSRCVDSDEKAEAEQRAASENLPEKADRQRHHRVEPPQADGGGQRRPQWAIRRK